MKTPEEIAREIVDKGMILSPSHGFSSMRERMESFITSAITLERSRAKRLVEALESAKEIIHDEFCSFEHHNFCKEVTKALAEYEGEYEVTLYVNHPSHYGVLKGLK